MSQAKPSDAEPQQKDPYSFPSQKFYNSNSSDVDHRQYEATYDISIEVIGNSEMSSKVDENDVHNMQYETGYDIHNEVRSESRLSETSLGSVTIAEYLNKDKIQSSISD